jgi:hypothetical protein
LRVFCPLQRETPESVLFRDGPILTNFARSVTNVPLAGPSTAPLHT